MAIEKKLIHFSKLSDFETQLNAGNILDYSIVFIQDAKKIWTHGQYYDCNGGNGTSDSPTFLRVGDADDEAKANFIAVANGEKSADYYICASSIFSAETNGIISSLVYTGPTSNPVYVSYTFYESPMSGGKSGKLLKITTTLTTSTSEITTTYEDVLDAKQDTITDLETIREGAAKGATSVQPDDISEFITAEDVAAVATSGSYEDLQDKPVYITDFDVLSLYNLAQNPVEVGGILYDSQGIANALAANKRVLVPYEISDNVFFRGYAPLVGYVEDLLYFKVITDTYEIYVETTFNNNEIVGREVTLNSWYKKQDELISGTNIKTINGESILGSGNLVIEDGTYIWDFNGSESGSITQDQWDALQRADNILISNSGAIMAPQMAIKAESQIVMYLIATNGLTDWNLMIITISSDLSYQTFIQGATYIKSGGLKTINGESLEGSGDIVISGGSSSGSSAYSEVSHGTADTTLTITPNTFHIWDEVSSLTLTLGAETSGVANEYLFQFTSGSTATTLSLPDDIKWTGGETPTIEANKIYQISILKGLGSVLEWNMVTIVDNFISISGNTLTFEYPTASELTIEVYGRTTDAPFDRTLTIPSGVSSYTESDLTNILYIYSVSPSSDNKYNYTYAQS